MVFWSTVHVMNEYLDNICIREDDTNRPKENVTPPLHVPYPKIYHIEVPKIISYANTSHFIFVFLFSSCIVISIFNLTLINIESILLLYGPLQLF